MACRLSSDPSETQLILCEVIAYRSELNSYDVRDIDDSQQFTVSEGQVYPLDQAENSTKKLTKGENVYALYPDTTMFYPAVILQAPKRPLQSTGSLGLEPIVILQFLDDEDSATGQVPTRSIPLKHIVRVS